MYLIVGIRHNLEYAVWTLLKYVDNTGHMHWNAVKRVIRYNILSKKVDIWFGSGKDSYFRKYM